MLLSWPAPVTIHIPGVLLVEKSSEMLFLL